MDAQARTEADWAAFQDEAVEAPPIVRFDERRMHIRAYNYWASLLGDRNLPSIESLNPAQIEDFGSHSLLLDFTTGVENPSIAFLGSALASQCDITSPIGQISEVPPRTLLSRLTDHYLQIIANSAPIGFEAEFTNQRGNEILYRGIMMPFSSDDKTIDFVYGVINWKEIASEDLSDGIAAEAQAQSVPIAPPPPASVIWSDEPLDAGADDEEDAQDDALQLSLDDRVEDMVGEEAEEAPFAADPDATLDDCLASAREAAAAANASEGRTRHALYRAIGLAHIFAIAARSRPDDYDALLAEAGIVAQPRSPMTALAKLVFGATYDKTRIAEFVCAIDHALERDLAPGALVDHLHAFPGGLKALVRQARAAKRGETARHASPPRALVKARRALAKAAPIRPEGVAIDEAGLSVMVMRREADGRIVPVAALGQDDALVARVLSAAARNL